MLQSIKTVGKKIKWYHAMVAKMLIISVFLVGILVYREIPFQAIGANVFVADVSLEGATYTEAANILDENFAALSKQGVVALFNDKKYEFELNELGVELNTYATIEKVYVAEYGENYWDGAERIFKSLFYDTVIDPVIEIDSEKFTAAIEAKIPDIKAPQNAEIIFNEEGKFEVIPHENGMKAFLEAPQKKLLNNLKNFQASTLNLEIPGEVLHPSIHEEEAKEAATRAQVYVEEPFNFTYKYQDYEYEHLIRFTRDWIDFETQDKGGVYSNIRYDMIQEYLNEIIRQEINIGHENGFLTALPEEGTNYATIEGKPKDGRALLVEETIDNFYEAIDAGLQETTLAVQELEGKIIDLTGNNLTFDLISTGKSNFAGSPDGRDFNVRRGLNEKVQGIYIAPGGVYDFNKNLGPVTNRAGWKNSLAIFGGKDLRPVPGGGLCQVSTTVYRAAIRAGLPILARSNHSLYVHYYISYGDGLDAAIYPGSKNLKFENDTGYPMLMIAYDDGDDGYVKIFGVPDGRQVELIGPFYPDGSYPEGQEAFKDKTVIRHNQIAWWQLIRDAEGNLLSEEQLTATYRTVPKKH